MSILIFTAAPLFSAGAASAAVAPYIADIFGEAGIERSPVRGKTGHGELRLLGTFKIFNPDTVPFYLWVTFDNGGQLSHVRPDRGQAIRLIDLELRYKNALHQPMVKEFPKTGVFGGAAPPARRRSGFGLSGGGSSGSGGRFGKKKPNNKTQIVDAETAASDADAAGARNRRGRGVGAVEIVFWKEDVQGYYEMELWGVLYAPDVTGARAPGSYVENIKFEIEPAR